MKTIYRIRRATDTKAMQRKGLAGNPKIVAAATVLPPFGEEQKVYGLGFPISTSRYEATECIEAEEKDMFFSYVDQENTAKAILEAYKQIGHTPETANLRILHPMATPEEKAKIFDIQNIVVRRKRSIADFMQQNKGRIEVVKGIAKDDDSVSAVGAFLLEQVLNLDEIPGIPPTPESKATKATPESKATKTTLSDKYYSEPVKTTLSDKYYSEPVKTTKTV
jgi:hypothetical protein